MELEVGRMILHQKKVERQVTELQFKLSEERRKRKRERKGRKVQATLIKVLASLSVHIPASNTNNLYHHHF